VASFPAAFYSTANWRFLEECLSKWFAERFRGPAAKGASLAQHGPDLFQVSRVLYRSWNHFVNPADIVFRAALASSQLMESEAS